MVIGPVGRFRVSVPLHPGDFAIPVMRSIDHQAGLSREECEAL